MRTSRSISEGTIITKAKWEPFQKTNKLNTHYTLIRPQRPNLKSILIAPVSNQPCFQVKCLVDQYKDIQPPDFILHPTSGIFNCYHHDISEVQQHKIKQLDNNQLSSIKSTHNSFNQSEEMEQLQIQQKLNELCRDKRKKWRINQNGIIQYQ